MKRDIFKLIDESQFTAGFFADCGLRKTERIIQKNQEEFLRISWAMGLNRDWIGPLWKGGGHPLVMPVQHGGFPLRREVDRGARAAPLAGARALPAASAAGSIAFDRQARLNFRLKAMALTTDQVRKIASLARLQFTPEEELRLAGELGAIVDYIDQLQGVEGEAGDAVAAAGAPEAEDRARPGLPREVFLANAPAAALEAFLVVPEVKGGGASGGEG